MCHSLSSATGNMTNLPCSGCPHSTAAHDRLILETSFSIIFLLSRTWPKFQVVRICQRNFFFQKSSLLCWARQHRQSHLPWKVVVCLHLAWYHCLQRVHLPIKTVLVQSLVGAREQTQRFYERREQGHEMVVPHKEEFILRIGMWSYKHTSARASTQKCWAQKCTLQL